MLRQQWLNIKKKINFICYNDVMEFRKRGIPFVLRLIIDGTVELLVTTAFILFFTGHFGQNFFDTMPWLAWSMVALAVVLFFVFLYIGDKTFAAFFKRGSSSVFEYSGNQIKGVIAFESANKLVGLYVNSIRDNLLSNGYFQIEDNMFYKKTLEGYQVLILTEEKFCEKDIENIKSKINEHSLISENLAIINVNISRVEQSDVQNLNEMAEQLQAGSILHRALFDVNRQAFIIREVALEYSSFKNSAVSKIRKMIKALMNRK